MRDMLSSPGRAWYGLATPLALFFLLPVLALLLRLSPAEFLHTLQNPLAWQAVRLSLFTSLISVAAAVLCGLPLAVVLLRPRSRLTSLLELLVDLPTVLPPAVAGLALLLAFGRSGLLGGPLARLGIELPFTTAAVVLAQLFVAAPLFIRSAALGLAAVEPDLIQAAELDGANGAQVFFFLTLPLARSGLISGAALAWARALGEFGATILFAGNFPGRTQTMPLAIYLGFEMDLDVSIALSVLLIGLSLAVLAGVRLLLGRSWFSPRGRKLPL